MHNVSVTLWDLFKALEAATRDADKALSEANGNLTSPDVCIAMDRRRVAFDDVEAYLDLHFDIQEALAWEGRNADAE